MEGVLGVIEFGEISGLVGLSCLCLLVLVGLVIASRISGQLARIERLLERRAEAEGLRVVGRTQKIRSSAGDFERFIIEDPSRRAMSKSEQFAAYRAWRKENGLSWGSREQELSGEKETKR